MIEDVAKHPNDQLTNYELVSKATDLLLNLSSTHALIAITAFNGLLKKSVAELLQNSIDGLGNEVIESFKRMVQSTSEATKNGNRNKKDN